MSPALLPLLLLLLPLLLLLLLLPPVRVLLHLGARNSSATALVHVLAQREIQGSTDPQFEFFPGPRGSRGALVSEWCRSVCTKGAGMNTGAAAAASGGARAPPLKRPREEGAGDGGARRRGGEPAGRRGHEPAGPAFNEDSEPEEEEDEEFKPGFSEEEDEEEGGEVSGSEEEEEARLAVSTAVTLLRMSKTELNGARAKVAPVPPGASAKPGRVHVELLSPVTGYEQGTVLSVPADKLGLTPLEHSKEEEELGVGTLVTLRMKSKPELNGGRAQVAQLPAAAATPMQQGRVRVELVKPTANYEAGTILSVPAHKMVLAHDVTVGCGQYPHRTYGEMYDNHQDDCISAMRLSPEEVTSPEMHTFRLYLQARRRAEAAAAGGAGSTGGVPSGGPPIVGTPVTLQQVKSKPALNGARGVVAPPPSGAAPGRFLVELFTPVTGYDEGDCVSVSEDKLVRTPLEHVVADVAAKHGVVMQRGDYKSFYTYDDVYSFDKGLCDWAVELSEEGQTDAIRAFRRYVRARRTAEAMLMAAPGSAISVGGACGSAGGRGGGHAPGAAPLAGGGPSRERWPGPASGALEHTAILTCGEHAGDTYEQLYADEPGYCDWCIDMRNADVETAALRRFISYVRRRDSAEGAAATRVLPERTRREARKAAGGR
ncbi:hypothetical protein FOA52_013046 [Chlamydomonas sp. UWO 241]|nr:hypothetical protein FOA52_013046 [Chlamydomonas sp. UWO 241]